MGNRQYNNVCGKHLVLRELENSTGQIESCLLPLLRFTCDKVMVVLLVFDFNIHPEVEQNINIMI
jgi:hypothetical protein